MRKVAYCKLNIKAMRNIWQLTVLLDVLLLLLLLLLQGSLYSKLTPMGYVLAGSTCVGVGISGLTLGGGIGHATRSLGLLADSVLAATVVLANGTVVEADTKSHPDLFWVSG
jgi:membrane protein required for beta-lactamase induction